MAQMLPPTRSWTRAVLAAAAATLLPVALPGVALASYPEDIVVQNLNSGGSPFGNSEWQSVFNFVAREMGTAISPKALAPASTLGLYGFELGFETGVAFLHTEEGASGDEREVSYWGLMTSSDADSLASKSPTPTPVVVMPTLRLRKGLPYSFEVGTHLSLLAGTHQLAIGGYGRWALNEGWRRIPDASITVAYTGYVGNEQLDLGVLEVDLAVGYSFPFGIDDKYAAARFSPFGGWGHGAIHASPKNVSDDISERLLPVTGFSGSSLAELDPATGNPRGIVDSSAFQYDKFFVGFSILSARFSYLIDAEFVVRGVHTLNMRFAFPF